MHLHLVDLQLDLDLLLVVLDKLDPFRIVGLDLLLPIEFEGATESHIDRGLLQPLHQRLKRQDRLMHQKKLQL